MLALMKHCQRIFGVGAGSSRKLASVKQWKAQLSGAANHQDRCAGGVSRVVWSQPHENSVPAIFVVKTVEKGITPAVECPCVDCMHLIHMSLVVRGVAVCAVIKLLNQSNVNFTTFALLALA